MNWLEFLWKKKKRFEMIKSIIRRRENRRKIREVKDIEIGKESRIVNKEIEEEKKKIKK